MLEERKQKYWGPERNARRREAYQNDPERAERVKQQRRESYKRRTAGDVAPNPSCIGNVAQVPSSGALMAVSFNGSPYVIGRVFTQTDVAKLLDRQPQVIYRWHARDLFPSPVLRDDKGNLYYADAEVTEFIKVLGEHQLTTPHYRSDHTHVRDRLFAASFQNHPSKAVAWLKSR